MIHIGRKKELTGTETTRIWLWRVLGGRMWQNNITEIKIEEYYGHLPLV